MIASASDLPLPNLLVIGAGPAGVSAAIRLRDRGHEVLLVDRATFPRDKLCGCCLNLAAIGALATIGCDEVVTRLTTESLNRWQMRYGERKIESRLPGGIAISRYAMDSALVNEAIRRGAQVRVNCDARIVDVSDETVDVVFRNGASGESFGTFQAVVFATGLSGGGVSRWLPYLESPNGPIGVGTVLENDNQNSMRGIEPRTIHMICGRDGYVGLVRLEDGRIDVAAAIRRHKADSDILNRKEIAIRLDRLLQGSGLPPIAVQREHQLRMTPPLTRRRKVGQGALLAVGDAAQYVEPFTGEGMAWAIESGIEAADCIIDQVSRKTPIKETLADQWKVRYQLLTKRRQWICRALSATLRSDTMSDLMVPAIRLAPWMAKWTISQLNRSHK